jgi:TATA box binding protein associated factor (TAF)
MQIEETLFPQLRYKLLEIVQEARKIMRHSKRDFMTAGDVELAMKKLNIPTVFGYPADGAFEFIALDFNNINHSKQQLQSHDLTA